MRKFLFIGFILLVGYSYTQTGTLTDSRDGKVYKTVVIGTQTWMVENLNVDRFRNGDLIPEVKSNEEWIKAGKEGKPAWCYYNNDPANGSKYGKLYNWYAISDSRGLAPKGYHIPSKEDWDTLFKASGKDKWGYDAANKLKSKSEWIGKSIYPGKPIKNGIDSYGFCVLPAGSRDKEGFFSGINSYTYFWCNNENGVWPKVIYTADFGYDEGISIAHSNMDYIYQKECTYGYSLRLMDGDIEYNNSTTETEQQSLMNNTIPSQNNTIYNANSNDKKSFIKSNVTSTNEKNFSIEYKRLNKDFLAYNLLLKQIKSDSNSIQEYTKNDLDKKILVENYNYILNSNLYKPDIKAIEKIFKKYDVIKDDYLNANSNNILIRVNLTDKEDNYIILPKQSFKIEKIKLEHKLIKKLIKENLTYVLDNEKASFCKSLTNLDQNYFVIEKRLQENTAILNKIKTDKLITSQNLYYFGDKVNEKKSGFGILLDNVNDTLFVGYWKEDQPDLLNGKVFSYKQENDVVYINYGNSVFGSSKLGMVFLGVLNNNQFQGNNIVVYPTGAYYNGNFNKGLKTGNGIEKLPNGDKYEGEYQNDKFNGKGKLFSLNGDIYSGNWLEGKKSGSGISTFASGSIYEGNFNNDERNGYGVYSWANGNKYIGNWKDDVTEGKGTFYFYNGDVYEGEFKGGKKHGEGIYKHKSGSIYDGNYADERRNGFGTYTFSNGDKYEGNYKEDEPDGKGKFTWESGDFYDGDWVNGIKNGKGKYVWSNGDIYVGDWVNNKRTGEGKLTYITGEVEKGTWINGYLISSNNDSPSSNRTIKTNQNQNNQKQCPKCGNFFPQELGWSYQFERVDENGKIKSLVIRKDGENCNPRRLGAGLIGGGDFKYCSCICAKRHNGEY